MKKRLFLSFAILFSVESGWACFPIYQKMKVKGASFEGQSFTLQDSDYGPAWSDGEASVVFRADKKKFCILEGDTTDCETLNDKKKFTVMKDKNKKPVGLLGLGSNPNQLLLFSIDPKKPVEAKNPEASIDRSKPWVSFEGQIDDGTSVSSVMQMKIMTSQGQIGQAERKMRGKLESDGKISYPRTRSMDADRPSGPGRSSDGDLELNGKFFESTGCHGGEAVDFSQSDAGKAAAKGPGKR